MLGCPPRCRGKESSAASNVYKRQVGAGGGAAIGAMFGPGGAVVGAGIGAIVGSIGALHEGGIVTGPQVSLIGEAGPEAVIPLNKLPRIMAEMNPNVPQNMTTLTRGGARFGQSEKPLTINFGSITISGGSNMTSASAREIIRTEMPKIVKGSYVSGARGVV